MNKKTFEGPLVETAEAISDFITQGARIGIELFESLSRNQATMAVGQLLRNVAPHLKRTGGSSCHIPPPCWMPRTLGDVVSHVCPGGTATIRIRVTNCTMNKRDIRIESVGNPEDIKKLKAEPPILSLGPMEHGLFVVSTPVPANAGFGQEHEILLWVRGCLDHYLRWTVKVAKRGADCCHELEVEDCPDYIHYWYDHFYCQRPCLH
jgi:hypothetical protein